MIGSSIGKHIIELEETDSTNSYASRLIYDQIPVEGTVILAHFQNAGRGQRGSHWESQKHKNLLISYILYPVFLTASKYFLLNQALSLGVCDFIRSKTSADVFIKWPNDITADNRKIAGMLIENTMRNDKIGTTIAGIGINLNQEYFEEFVLPATSIKLLENKEYDIKKCLLQLNEHIDKWYTLLQTGNHQKIEMAYLSSLFRRGDLSNFESKGKTFEGTIQGVNASGQLIIHHNDGSEHTYNNKEIKLIF